MRRTILLFVLCIMVAASCGCAGQQKPAPVSPAPMQDQHGMPLKGVALTPLSFQSSDFTGFFEKAQKAGTIVAWAGDWDELGVVDKGGPVVVSQLASTYHYVPVIEAQFFTQSSGTLIRPLDMATRQRYVASAAAFAEKYHPRYLALGIEVNTLHEKNPGQFNEFVSLYHDTCHAVKEKSPDTRIFPVFQLERMKGLGGGLFGGTNDTAKAEWPLIDRFLDADLVGFTTYPGLIYNDPSAIPADYYSEIGKHTGKKIAFTEIGWHSAAEPAGWESSGAEQAEFVTIFFNRTRDVNTEFAIWSFLYDQNAPVPFNSMGLYSRDGTARPAWNRWVSAGQ